MAYRILVVSHDAGLRLTRSTLLIRAGYDVDTAQSAESAMSAVSTSVFDLVVVGRNSLSDRVPVDQQLRTKYPNILILKIVDLIDQGNSFATRMTDARPAKVLAAMEEMLSGAGTEANDDSPSPSQ